MRQTHPRRNWFNKKSPYRFDANVAPFQFITFHLVLQLEARIKQMNLKVFMFRLHVQANVTHVSWFNIKIESSKAHVFDDHMIQIMFYFRLSAMCV